MARSAAFEALVIEKPNLTWFVKCELNVLTLARRETSFLPVMTANWPARLKSAGPLPWRRRREDGVFYDMEFGADLGQALAELR